MSNNSIGGMRLSLGNGSESIKLVNPLSNSITDVIMGEFF